MSWLEKITDTLTITTGEGSEFTPQWKNPSRLLSWHIASFDFPNVAGTLVQRRLPKGAQYAVEFYFQGEDHLDEAERFKIASSDPRPWVLSHPYYGRLVVQPTQLTVGNEDYNVSRFSGTLYETIEENGIETELDPQEEVGIKAKDLREAGALNFTAADPDTLNLMGSRNDVAHKNYSKNLETDSDLNEVITSYNQAKSAITEGVETPVEAMRKTQNMLAIPARISGDFDFKASMLQREFDRLMDSSGSVTGIFQKTAFESQGSSIISAQTELVTSAGFETRTEVLAAAAEVVTNYNTFLENLDSLQGNGYFPRRELIAALEDLVNFTLSQLFKIASRAQQERRVILTDDSNVILLTHKYYGLDEEDANIERFMKTNDIGLNETLEIRKGREVVYYV